MHGAIEGGKRVWLLAVNCTVSGALDGKEVAFMLRLHANVRTYGCFFSVIMSICSQYHSSMSFGSHIFFTSLLCIFSSNENETIPTWYGYP